MEQSRLILNRTFCVILIRDEENHCYRRFSLSAGQKRWIALPFWFGMACNESAPKGTPIMHIGGVVRGKGKFVITEYIPTDERTGSRSRQPRRRNHLARAAHRTGRTGRGLHHVPSSGHPGQRDHRRVFRLGHELPGIQGHGGADLASNGPSEWQKAYDEQARHSRRIAPVVEAAE
jgi:hypothetical protein